MSRKTWLVDRLAGWLVPRRQPHRPPFRPSDPGLCGSRPL